MKVRLLVALISIALLGAAFYARSGPSVAPDFPTNVMIAEQSEVVIDIPNGSSGSEIAQLLFDNGVVKSSEAFFRVAVGDKRSEKIAPGNHRISQNISAQQALEQLLDSDRIPNLIRIFEGGWKSEVVTALIDYGFTKVEINKALTSVVLPKGFKDSEGLLFPAQYTFASGTSAAQAVQAMIDRFIAEPIALALMTGDKEFSAMQLLTIASIIRLKVMRKILEKFHK